MTNEYLSLNPLQTQKMRKYSQNKHNYRTISKVHLDNCQSIENSLHITDHRDPGETEDKTIYDETVTIMEDSCNHGSGIYKEVEEGEMEEELPANGESYYKNNKTKQEQHNIEYRKSTIKMHKKENENTKFALTTFGSNINESNLNLAMSMDNMTSVMSRTVTRNPLGAVDSVSFFGQPEQIEQQGSFILSTLSMTKGIVGIAILTCVLFIFLFCFLRLLVFAGFCVFFVFFGRYVTMAN